MTNQPETTFMIDIWNPTWPFMLETKANASNLRSSVEEVM